MAPPRRSPWKLGGLLLNAGLLGLGALYAGGNLWLMVILLAFSLQGSANLGFDLLSMATGASGATACFAAAWWSLWIAWHPEPALPRQRRWASLLWLAGTVAALPLLLIAYWNLPPGRKVPKDEVNLALRILAFIAATGWMPAAWLLREAWRRRPRHARGKLAVGLAFALLAATAAWFAAPAARRWLALREGIAAGDEWIGAQGDARLPYPAFAMAMSGKLQSARITGFDRGTADRFAGFRIETQIEIRAPKDERAAVAWLQGLPQPPWMCLFDGGDYAFVAPSDGLKPCVWRGELRNSTWRFDTAAALPAATRFSLVVEDVRWAPCPPAPVTIPGLQVARTPAPPGMAGRISVQALRLVEVDLPSWTACVATGNATTKLEALVVFQRRFETADAQAVSAVGANLEHLELATIEPPDPAALRALTGFTGPLRFELQFPGMPGGAELQEALRGLRKKGVTVRFRGVDWVD